MYINKPFIIFSLIVTFCCISFHSWTQNKKTTEGVILNDRLSKVSEATKLDVHRFMGNEHLLPKYLSLPYDTNMNTNVQGELVDTSYLLILFLPILLLFSIKNSWFRLLLITILSLMYLTSSFSGYGAYRNISQSQIAQQLSTELSNVRQAREYIPVFKLSLLQITNKIGQPLTDFLATISGVGDSITYPFLLVFFLLFSTLLFYEYQSSKYPKEVFVFFSITYFFFWWILGAGVAHYGILFLPVGLFAVIFGYCRLKEKLDSYFPNFLLSLIIIWIIVAFTSRLSNYRPKNKVVSRNAIPLSALAYGLGKIDKKRALNFSYPNYNQAIAVINADKQALVYKVGTFFYYFISNNNVRVLEDNQLDKFAKLKRKYTFKGDAAVINAFKRAGYKYFVIDLKMGKIDKSPNSTLKKRIRLLSDFFAKNTNKFRVIATDRLMEDKAGKRIYSLKGKKLINEGTFVVLELL